MPGTQWLAHGITCRLSRTPPPRRAKIVTLSRDKDRRSFADFLRYMAQMRLNPEGEVETLKPDDWLALRERMLAVRRAGTGQDTPCLRILRRFVPE